MTEKKPEAPEWVRDLVAGEPAGVMSGVLADSRHGISTSASLIPTARQRSEDKVRAPSGGEATLQVPGLRWPTEYRYPDETYRDRHVVDVGGERFELHHARGETDDHTWTWVPARRVLCCGDLFEYLWGLARE